MKDNKKPSPFRSLGIGITILLILIIYAYGFEITQVDLQELRSEQRQSSLIRVTRALFQPDIFDYEQETQVFNAPVFVTTCPEGVSENAEVNPSQPYVTVTPSCAEP